MAKHIRKQTIEQKKIKKILDPHMKSVLKLRLRETWYVPMFKVQDQLNQDTRIIHQTTILKNYLCSLSYEIMMEKQKVLKDNSLLIDG